MSELLSINVNEHTEKKGGLTYLSWAWAWAEVLKHDATATYSVRMFGDSPVCKIGDTALVCVSVTIKGLTRECWLPAMDNRNNAVKNPDARKVSDAIMRCMTKAVALHGLGLYIYAGEDLPQTDAEPAPAKGLPIPDDVRASPTDGAGDGLDDTARAYCEDLALHMVDCHKSGNDLEAIATWYEASNWPDDVGDKQEQQKYVWHLLRAESKLRSAIKANAPAKVAA